MCVFIHNGSDGLHQNITGAALRPHFNKGWKKAQLKKLNAQLNWKCTTAFIRWDSQKQRKSEAIKHTTMSSVT